MEISTQFGSTSVERHSSAMRTSILLGVICIILLGLLESGECQPAKRSVEVSFNVKVKLINLHGIRYSLFIKAVEATTTGLVRDVEVSFYD